MAAVEPQVDKSIDLVMEYKRGLRPLDETVDRLKKMTGLSKDTAEAFLLGMTRHNVYKFVKPYKKSKHG